MKISIVQAQTSETKYLDFFFFLTKTHIQENKDKNQVGLNLFSNSIKYVRA